MFFLFLLVSGNFSRHPVVWIILYNVINVIFIKTMNENKKGKDKNFNERKKLYIIYK